jgi:divalent metal cation (Fe/Co/Zn/Cd) transporter
MGSKIIRSSVGGLMDSALPSEEQDLVRKILKQNIEEGVEFHDLRTRQAGAGRFIAFHLIVPSYWSVQRGHDLLDKIEAEIQRALPDTTIDSHIEPNIDAENKNASTGNS